MMKKNVRLVVFEQGTPLRELVGLMKLDDHSAYQAEHIGQPTRDAARTSVSAGVLGSAAYRGEVCRASTAAGEGR
jgi:hypothetical protein